MGDIRHSLTRIAELAEPSTGPPMRALREALVEEMGQHAQDTGFPVKPQKIIWDLRTALNFEDVVICDVGAHKMWMARMFRCEYPNTCIISNGFASMGIAVPGAIAAKLVYPDSAVVAVTGDAGFLMNSQEIETAMRHRHADRHPDLERWWLRLDRMETDESFQARLERQLRQPGLR